MGSIEKEKKKKKNWKQCKRDFKREEKAEEEKEERKKPVMLEVKEKDREKSKSWAIYDLRRIDSEESAIGWSYIEEQGEEGERLTKDEEMISVGDWQSMIIDFSMKGR